MSRFLEESEVGAGVLGGFEEFETAKIKVFGFWALGFRFFFRFFGLGVLRFGHFGSIFFTIT